MRNQEERGRFGFWYRFIFQSDSIIQDTSKQGFAACTAHGLNLWLAIWLASDTSDASIDSCAWFASKEIKIISIRYFMTIAFDTTLGVFVSISFLKLIDKLCIRFGFKV